jgi:hypothetical protein
VYKKAVGITFTFLFLAICTMAQDIIIHGEFHEDSVKIGVPTPYSLTARYPKSLNVIFPDSLYNFSPFEYESRDYYTTQTDSLQSFDSVVYYLSTFEIDSIQRLTLPVYQINAKDSTTFLASPDSVFLIELIEQLPDSVELKENTSYLNIPTQFNYPYFLIGMGALVIVTIILILIFGKRIQKMWLTFKLNRRFKKYVIKHDIAVDKVLSKITLEGANNIVQVWKKYLEKLEKQPFTKLTTKEISKLYNGEDEVITVLKNIDRLIYGGKEMDNVSFDVLKNFAAQRTENKKEEVKNG